MFSIINSIQSSEMLLGVVEVDYTKPSVECTESFSKRWSFAVGNPYVLCVGLLKQTNITFN
jgi:hypothetical protein